MRMISQTLVSTDSTRPMDNPCSPSSNSISSTTARSIPSRLRHQLAFRTPFSTSGVLIPQQLRNLVA
jgi:hypothetical protein